MPESREGEASFITLDDNVSSLLEEGVSLDLERIDIDATDKECARFPKNHPAREGLPYTIDSASTVKRGINKAQNYVYPEMWRTTGKSNEPKGSLTNLTLKGLTYTHRALILDLGPLFLMVFPLFCDMSSLLKLADSMVNTYIGAPLSPFRLRIYNEDYS